MADPSYVDDTITRLTGRVRELEVENAALHADNAMLRHLLNVPLLLAATPATAERAAELDRWLTALPGKATGLRSLVGGAA